MGFLQANLIQGCMGRFSKVLGEKSRELAIRAVNQPSQGRSAILGLFRQQRPVANGIQVARHSERGLRLDS